MKTFLLLLACASFLTVSAQNKIQQEPIRPGDVLQTDTIRMVFLVSDTTKATGVYKASAVYQMAGYELWTHKPGVTWIEITGRLNGDKKPIAKNLCVWSTRSY